MNNTGQISLPDFPVIEYFNFSDYSSVCPCYVSDILCSLCTDAYFCSASIKMANYTFITYSQSRIFLNCTHVFKFSTCKLQTREGSRSARARRRIKMKTKEERGGRFRKRTKTVKKRRSGKACKNI